MQSTDERELVGEPTALGLTIPISSEGVFDACADDYHEQLLKGLRLSGESPDFFAKHRAQSTARLVDGKSRPVERLLDFGCGVGTATPFLMESFPCAQIFGSDISQQAIETARSSHRSDRLKWVYDLAGIPPHSMDVIYCNGVFHHIPPADRDPILRRLAQLLRPGGNFALWENNPWNPGTRWIMSRVPFDRDAVCLTPIETRRRLRRAGLTIRKTEYHFYFPHCLASLRVIEPLLRRIALGGQYVVMASSKCL